MINTLVVPRQYLTRWLVTFNGSAEASGVCRLGETDTSEHRLLLAREVALGQAVPPAEFQRRQFLQFLLSEQPPGGWPYSNWPPGIQCQLWLRPATGRGFVAGILRTATGIEPLHRLWLPGSGMHQLPLFESPVQMASANGERHSRTIGALGSGAIWRGLTALHFAIVGCGRTGSLVAGNLARLGVHALTLIDPDLLEEHSLGEMDLVREDALGLPKVDGLARALDEVTGLGNGKIRTLPVALSHHAALAACREADVIFVCADRDAARLTAAIVATLNHKVLVDIGTGIQFNDPVASPDKRSVSISRSPVRNMGADVRLILPGDGCLLCRGNLTQYTRAIEEVISRPLPVVQDTDWHRQRAGSLRSLNQVGAGIAVQMLQDLVAERIQTSLWAHIECDNAGRFSIAYPAVRMGNAPCPLCAKAGQGDAAFNW